MTTFASTPGWKMSTGPIAALCPMPPCSTASVCSSPAGVDYHCEVLLNGRVLLEQEGMFTPIEIDLTGASAGDELLVRIFPAPKSQNERIDRSQANRYCKPAVSYGWDFHPRLIPLGIWQNAGLQIVPAGAIRRWAVSYRLNEDLSLADVQVSVEPCRPLPTQLTGPCSIRMANQCESLSACRLACQRAHHSLGSPAALVATRPGPPCPLPVHSPANVAKW